MSRACAVRAAFCATLLLLTACGSGARPKRPGAAEPAEAPPTAATPAGTVVRVGAGPEGIAYDARSNLVAVAVRSPNRLLLLDPATLAIRRSVPLPGDVRHLQIGERARAVLVPVESANQLVQVALPSGTTTATRVRKQPHDAAQAANGDIVVGDEFGKSISILRGSRVIKTIADLDQPGGVVANGTNTVGVVDVGAFTVSTYDVDTLRRTGRVGGGEGPTHGNALPGSRYVVADTRGNQMLIYSVSPLRRTAAFALPGTPYGMAVDSTTQTVWVTLTARNQVVGLDVSGATPRIVARYPTVRQPNTVAVAPGSKRLWVTGFPAGVIQVINR